MANQKSEKLKWKPTKAHLRRYKLHQIIKGVVNYKAKQKTVFTCENELNKLSEKPLKAIKELANKFGYNIQTEIR